MTEYIPTQDQLNDKLWRLTNLYYITDKSGNEILFNLNWAQKELFYREWHQMLVLKARQLGVTSYFSINFFDDCFWHANTNAGIIAHRKEDAEDIFKKKVKYAYDRMPRWTRTFNSATNDRSGELAFANGSTYRVSTGFRSGTYQRLLVSEFGKICARSPEVAKEIVTGSLNTVSTDQIIAIESTAEGREGYFYDFSKQAEELSLSGKELSPMQMRFFFFPWYEEPGYREPFGEIAVSKETNEYLDHIEAERQRKIDEEQRRWYEMKLRMLGDSMKQEYPSTPKEAFESANEGLYYGTQLAKLRAGGSVCKVPYDDSMVVHTAWDIGLDDFTSIFCFQVGRGGQVSIINYYENWDEGAAHYCDWLNKQKYRFGRHVFPHDARKRDAGSKTQYLDHVTPLLEGKFVVLDIKECDKLEGIQTVRSMLSRCIFDEEKASKGLRHLEAYKKVWDDRLGCYKNTPLHDEHSHACFVGDTLISTLRGNLPIKEVIVGDMVLTPYGYKRVCNTFCYIVGTLYKITTTSSEFTCTYNHKIFTENSLIYADSLRYNDVVIHKRDHLLCQIVFGYRGKEKNLGFRDYFSSVKMTRLSISMDIDINGMDVTIEKLLEIPVLSQHFKEAFGHIISGRSKQDFIFIIETKTREIIILRILRKSKFHIICDYIIPKKDETILGKPLKKLCFVLKTGMLLQKGLNGIRKMVKSLLQRKSGLKSLVRFAHLNTQHLGLIQDSVVTDVNKNIDINQGLITKQEVVQSVELNSSAISTCLKERVLKTVKLSLESTQEVYDLEIEDDHCYYANDVLVSNSDAFRYLAVGLKGLERKDNSSIDNDLKAVNKYYGN